MFRGAASRVAQSLQRLTSASGSSETAAAASAATAHEPPAPAPAPTPSPSDELVPASESDPASSSSSSATPTAPTEPAPIFPTPPPVRLILTDAPTMPLHIRPSQMSPFLGVRPEFSIQVAQRKRAAAKIKDELQLGTSDVPNKPSSLLVMELPREVRRPLINWLNLRNMPPPEAPTLALARTSHIDKFIASGLVSDPSQVGPTGTAAEADGQAVEGTQAVGATGRAVEGVQAAGDAQAVGGAQVAGEAQDAGAPAPGSVSETPPAEAPEAAPADVSEAAPAADAPEAAPVEALEAAPADVIEVAPTDAPEAAAAGAVEVAPVHVTEATPADVTEAAPAPMTAPDAETASPTVPETEAASTVTSGTEAASMAVPDAEAAPTTAPAAEATSTAVQVETPSTAVPDASVPSAAAPQSEAIPSAAPERLPEPPTGPPKAHIRSHLPINVDVAVEKDPAISALPRVIRFKQRREHYIDVLHIPHSERIPIEYLVHKFLATTPVNTDALEGPHRDLFFLGWKEAMIGCRWVRSLFSIQRPGSGNWLCSRDRVDAADLRLLCYWDDLDVDLNAPELASYDWKYRGTIAAEISKMKSIIFKAEICLRVIIGIENDLWSVTKRMGRSRRVGNGLEAGFSLQDERSGIAGAGDQENGPSMSRLFDTRRIPSYRG